MDSDDRRSRYQDGADRYLRHVDDTYVFDESSGLYKPISRHKQNDAEEKRRVEVQGQPLRIQTKVDWDWLDILFKTLGFLATVATLVLLWLTVRYAHRQWKAMDQTLGEVQKQTVSVKESADAAKKSADVGEEMLLTSRAVISLGGPRIDAASRTISFNIENTGKIRSGTIRIVSYAEVNTMEKPQANSQRGYMVAYWRQTRYDGISAGDQTSIGYSPVLNIDVDAIRSGLQSFVIGFEITYNDGFTNTPARKISRVMCSYAIGPPEFIRFGECLPINSPQGHSVESMRL